MACRKKFCATVSSSGFALLKCHSPRWYAAQASRLSGGLRIARRSSASAIAGVRAVVNACVISSCTAKMSARLRSYRSALVCKGVVPGDYEQRGMTRERCDHVFGDAVRDELLLGVAAHVGEES